MAPLIPDLVPLGSLQRQANPVQICSKDCESDRSSEAIPAVRANPVQAAAFQVVDGGFYRRMLPPRRGELGARLALPRFLRKRALRRQRVALPDS